MVKNQLFRVLPDIEIIQILLALTLIVYIFISGKKKYKERRIS